MFRMFAEMIVMLLIDGGGFFAYINATSTCERVFGAVKAAYCG